MRKLVTALEHPFQNPVDYTNISSYNDNEVIKLKSQKLTGEINGWAHIAQYNPMILHIWLKDAVTDKNLDCLIIKNAVDFLESIKLNIDYTIVLWGKFNSDGIFVASNYSLRFKNPFRFYTRNQVRDMEFK